MTSHDETPHRGPGFPRWVPVGSLPSRKLGRSLRNQHPQVPLSGSASSRPQTPNHSSSLNETVIRKIFVPHRTKEEIYSVGRRITRAMEGEKAGRLLQSPKSIIIEPSKEGTNITAHKHRNDKPHIMTSNKAGDTGVRVEVQVEKPVKSVKSSKQSVIENPTVSGKVDSCSPKDTVSNHRLTRLDVVKIKALQENGKNEFDNIEKDTSESKDKKIRQPVILEGILGKAAPPAVGVITRGKAIMKDRAIEVDDKKPSLTKTKDTATRKYDEGAELKAEQRQTECANIPPVQESLGLHNDKNQRKRDGGVSIVNQELKDDNCSFHAVDVGSPIVRKRGRPLGSKKKPRPVEVKVMDVREKRGRRSVEDSSSRMKHSCMHDSVASLSVVMEKSVTERGRRHGVLLRDAGKRKSTMKTGESGIVISDIDAIEPTVDLKQASRPQIKAVVEILSKRGRPCGSSTKGREHWKNSVAILQTSKESKHYTDAVVMAKNMGTLQKQGRPRGGLSRVGSKLKDSLMTGDDITKEMQGMPKEGVTKTATSVLSGLKLSKTSFGLLRKRGMPVRGSIRGRVRWKGSTKQGCKSCENAGGVGGTRPHTKVPRKRGRSCRALAEGKRRSSLSRNSTNGGFLSLKRRKRIRMMNVLDDSIEMIDHEGVHSSKRRRIMATVTTAKKNTRKIKKIIMENGMPNKTNENICSLDLVSADDFELKLVNSNNMFGLEACNDWLHSEANNMGAGHVVTTSKIAEDAIETRKDVANVDFGSQVYLVAMSPLETGGRQMRPRPLDLRQPLITLVEGRDQEYYEFDGGAFFRMLQQQIEPSNLNTEKFGTLENDSVAEGNVSAKENPILLPAFRTQRESEESLQMSSVPYTVPETYIKVKHEKQNNQADYDIDEEDEVWLNEYNQTLPSSWPLTADQFENIIDLLESKAAILNRVNSAIELLEEEQKSLSEECCICNGGENAEHNLVLRCTACHIVVHQSCYGIHESIVQGKENWQCRKCEAVFQGKENSDISCALCCKKGGALKPSTEPHKWAHVVCALYTNETYFVNPDAMEPIDGLSAASTRAKRQRRQCWLCGMKEGSVEKCSEQGCKAVFHVSCGVLQGASFELQHFNHQVISVRIYCPAHAIIVANSRVNEEHLVQNEKLSYGGDNDCIVANVSSNAKTVSKRKGRRRKGRIQKKDLLGKGKVELDCNSVDQESKLCINANGDESLVHSRKSENVIADTVIRQVRTILKAHEMGERDITELINQIYLYWISKRKKHGGPLLHRIQQEQAAKKFGIFNAVDDSLGDGDMATVSGRREVVKLEELTNLVAERERLKVHIRLLNQDILRVTADFLKSRGSRGTCVECDETGLLASCTSCSRTVCFYCSMINRGFKYDSDWLASLKKFICLNCLKQTQTQKNYNVLSPTSAVSTFNQMDGESSIWPAKRKPYMLLPRLHCMHQNRLATKVFWQQSRRKRTIPISNLLRMPKPS